MWPFSIIKKQKAEIERLNALVHKQLMGEITLEDLRANNGDLSLTLAGSPLHLFADAFYSQFEEWGATNFLTMDFNHKDSGEKFEVTMQKVSGESVCDQLKRLHGELDEFKRIKK